MDSKTAFQNKMNMLTKMAQVSKEAPPKAYDSDESSGDDVDIRSRG